MTGHSPHRPPNCSVTLGLPAPVGGLPNSTAHTCEPASGLLLGHGGVPLQLLTESARPGFPPVDLVPLVAVPAQRRPQLLGAVPQPDVLGRLPPFVGEVGTALGTDRAPSVPPKVLLPYLPADRLLALLSAGRRGDGGGGRRHRPSRL